VGGNYHGPEEYIEEASIVPRIALVALLIARAGVTWSRRIYMT
jgi:acetylornithine deacetylase/succinyl-diaminopimelate desuccinylase-like protein